MPKKLQKFNEKKLNSEKLEEEKSSNGVFIFLKLCLKLFL
jgi:hypothetical protein